MSNWQTRPCKTTICKNTTRNGSRYCDSCEQDGKAKAHDNRRGTAHQRGYDARWQKERAYFLADNPLCVFHLKKGQYVPATVVDHIEPHRGNTTIFWDKSNWQPLCKHCHDSVKQRMER